LIYRRQRQQYIFAGFLAVIAVVNVLFFLILNRPAQTEYARLEESIRQLRAQVAGNQSYITSLMQTNTHLDQFDKDKKALLAMHLIERTTGYSQIVSTLEEIVQHSGVEKTRVAYNLDPKLVAGLNTVSITVPLRGNYNNVVNFIRELENSDKFFLINQIELVGSRDSDSQPVAVNASDGPGAVSLSLAAETFFYQ
jgi:Tfp pilus assembly protein PilO